MEKTSVSSTLYAEDVPVGVPLWVGSYEVTKKEIIEFAQAWDPQSFHIDSHAARSGYYGEVIASGVHTIGIFQRLAVLSLYQKWAIIAGKEFENLIFRRPVLPGDTLNGQVIVRKVLPDDRGRAEIEIEGALKNQKNEVVLTLTMRALMRMRP